MKKLLICSLLTLLFSCKKDQNYTPTNTAPYTKCINMDVYFINGGVYHAFSYDVQSNAVAYVEYALFYPDSTIRDITSAYITPLNVKKVVGTYKCYPSWVDR